MPVSNPKWHKIRLEILRRDAYTCAYCGQVANEVDHIIPRQYGGDESPDNLTACCATCNRSKGTKSRPGRATNNGLRFNVDNSAFPVDKIDSRLLRRSSPRMTKKSPPGAPSE